MTVRYPKSFFLLIAVVVVTAALAVVWNLAHIVLLALDVMLITGLRSLAHHEVRHGD